MTTAVAETVTYLGFPIKVMADERTLAIYTPSGRLVAMSRMEFSTARSIIRSYRKGGGPL